MTILVIGGTGTVGRHVVRGLLEAGVSVRVLTRSTAHEARIPDPARAVVGDLTNPSTLHGVFHGVDRLFLLNAVSATEVQEALVALNEAQRADVKRIVYLSIHRAERGLHIPHFAAKVAVEHALKAGAIPHTILRANNFYQNDISCKEALLTYGVYPQPFGNVGVARVDVRDVARAGANALLNDGHAGRTYALVGPETLTGDACAAAYGHALGTPIRYAGNDLDAWSAQVRDQLPSWMLYDLRLMYALFQEQGMLAAPLHYRETCAVLGRAPRPFAAFAAETTARWMPERLPRAPA